jgi:hypothetical protein
MLQRIFRPKTQEEAGGWRELCNKEIHNLCYSLNTVGRITYRTGGGKEKCTQNFGEKNSGEETTWETYT